MAAEEQEALREFMAVMGTEEERARFVLETAGWDLQVAPRGGPLRTGWGIRSAASALRSEIFPNILSSLFSALNTLVTRRHCSL
ncbi:hypothetical protein EI005_25400, partial [Escherichia coli]|nr:hypothetical protein [Escherichia coli]